MLGVIGGLALGALGAGMSAYQSGKNRRAMAEAQEEQRKQDAWDQLIQAAGGQGVSKASPIQPLPAADYATPVAQLGKLFTEYDRAQQADSYREALLELKQMQAQAAAQDAGLRRSLDQAKLAKEVYGIGGGLDPEIQLLNSMLRNQGLDPIAQPQQDTLPGHVVQHLQQQNPWLTVPNDPLNLFLGGAGMPQGMQQQGAPAATAMDLTTALDPMFFPK